MLLYKEYCCDNKCFEIPDSQVDGLACTRCNSFCYCICHCEMIKQKMSIFTNKILKKAEELKNETNSMIGVRIYKGKGFVCTNCSYIKKDDEEFDDMYFINNNFYLYHDALYHIPELSFEPNEHTIIIKKTYLSKIYVIDFK